MSQPHICPSCQCLFHQDFVCITCGAEKLYDETVRVLQAENARLREALECIGDMQSIVFIHASVKDALAGESK